MSGFVVVVTCRFIVVCFATTVLLLPLYALLLFFVFVVAALFCRQPCNLVLFIEFIYLFFGLYADSGLKIALGRGFEPHLEQALPRSCNSVVRVGVL